MSIKKYLSKEFIFNRLVLSSILAIFLAIGSWFLFAHYTQVLPDSAIYFLNDVRVPQKGDRVLIFSPHPDDETIALGGYIYQAEQNGAKVKIVLVTDGNKHGLKDERYQEFRNATAILGVDESNLVFLNEPDGRLNKVGHDKVYNEMKQEIDNFNPTFVLFSSPKDGHPDHAYVGEISDQILNNENYRGMIYQYLVHETHFPQPKKYAPKRYLLPPESMVSFDREWQRLMLSDSAQLKKTEAIEAYKSQISVPFLRSLIFSMDRKNELFSINQGNQ